MSRTITPKTSRVRKGVRIFWWTFFGFVTLFLSVVLLAMAGVFGKMPSLKQLENPSILQASEVYAVDGTLMGKYYSERGNRSNVDYGDISKHVIHALVATEDFRFYDHSGIDWRRTGKAIITLGADGGGSTISQQLAKALLDQGSKNRFQRVIEKVKEWIIAIRLERNFTKQEIIALYLNAVPYGDNIYGIRNASKTFFQKEPDRLAPEEAAILVGMLKANYTYNPRVNPKAALDRRNVVLGQMEKNNYLTTAEATRLKALPIKYDYKKMDENTGYAPYFREVLREEVRDALKGLERQDGEPYDIYDDGLKIYTTINPRMQDYAEEAVAQQMPLLQKQLNSQSNIKSGKIWAGRENVLDAAMRVSDRWKHGEAEGLSETVLKESFRRKVPMTVFAWNAKRNKDTVMTPMDSIKYHRQMLQTAFMVMDPTTGEVRAWVGGIDFKTWKLDHANLRTKRQVGSTIKPLLYAQAMEERGFTAETPVQDVQQSFPNGMVPNTGRTCTGRSVSMASALAWSRNCATAYIMKNVGPAQFANFLERINIPTKVEPFPAIALGSCDLSLYEMLWGYTIFPGRGFSTKPIIISRIEDRNGNVIKRFDYSKGRKEAISEATAYNMCKLMEGPVTKGTAAGLMQRLGVKEMGGKTGTTNSNADFWFMGFTPQLLAGCWIGCDDRFIQITSGAFYGGSTARPIWESFFKKAYNDKNLLLDKEAIFQKPTDLMNELSNADIQGIIEDTPPPDAEGVDVGVGNANDYGLDESYDTLGGESRVPGREDPTEPTVPPVKPPVKKDTAITPADPGTAKAEGDKKGGLFKGLFKKKEKEPKKEETNNDY